MASSTCTVTKDVSWGTTSGTGIKCSPLASRVSIRTNESLSGLGGTETVGHQAITVTSRNCRSDRVIVRSSAS